MFRIGSIFIPVTDLEKASKWYEKMLGVKKIDSWEEGVGFYFPSGSTQLALIQVDIPQSSEFIVKNEEKNSYFNFIVDHIEEVYEYLNKNGVKTTEIKDFGGMKYFDFFDLDGNPFSVVDEPINSPFHSANIQKLQNTIF
ncbi:VOC family protein [Niallia sp. Sow4_A1]|jgi:glyoxylase I family protein|uniref:VOC family protein n=1 Tax=Niallia hominis TaxID=3133173 RepID=A0ABV1F5E9_9BACI|nr:MULTISPECIES: VOC family protein [Bacillaceae]MCF2648463.1 VOC family protein [Niallia circulans]MCM3361056.1 VOC family protein [Niallia sp. MER TA 168]REB73293.1 VOC family protein [Cutibacterium acnes]